MQVHKKPQYNMKHKNQRGTFGFFYHLKKGVTKTIKNYYFKFNNSNGVIQTSNP